MAYHRGAHAGAVAVSYSTNTMPTPLSPTRRYSSGNTGTTTSGVGSSSSSKLSSYRSSASSSFDRPSYYNSGSSSSSSGYSSVHRSSYSSEYRRYCSPSRSLSVSSSSYSDTGTGSTISSGISSSNNSSSNRYSTSSFSSSRDRSSESRETLGSLATSAADLYAKYSPAHYVPNISASNERNSSLNNNSNIGKGASSTSSSSTSSSATVNGYGNNTASVTANAVNNSSSSLATPIFGGNSSNARISQSLQRGENHQDLLSTGSAVVQGRPPRAARRSPVNTVINNHAQLQPESAANYAEVNFDGDDSRRNGGDDDNDDHDAGVDINIINGDKNNNKNDNERNSNDDNVHVDGNDNENKIPVSRVNLNYRTVNTAASYGSDFSGTVTAVTCRTDITGGSNIFVKNNQTHAACTRVNNLTNSNADDIADGKGLIIASKSACVSPSINQSNNALVTNTEITNNNFDTCDYTGADPDGDEDRAAASEAGCGVASDSGTLKNGIVKPENFYRSKLTSFVNDEILISLFDSKNDEQELDDANSLIYINSGGADTVVRKNLASRPTGNHAGDSNSSSLPSTSRRGDNYSGNGNNSHGSNGIGNTTSQLAGSTQQNIYRGINDQIEGSPTIRAPRNRLQAPRDERCGLNGLRNIGNTCFMNSVIQCLSNTRPLLEYLVNEQYLADINTTTSSMKGALIKAFSQVIQELWEVGGDHVVNTASLKSQIQRFAPRFMGYSQQDAQEFLRYLLEGLHEDVNRVTVKPQPIHTDIPEHYTESQKAAESWKRYLRNEDSTIVDAFVGQLRSSLHCTSCGHVSVTLDPFWDLSLPIPTRSGTVKLNQCLEHFTKEEVLDGDEKPTCSKCQMRRKCTKRFSIQKFPKILVIHLKRFSPMERFRGKLNTLVDFPLTGLDLGAFSAPRVAGCTYNLYGVANHSGTTYSGHYTAYCKHPYSGEWHEYNDSRVSSIAARSVVSSEGYVLFYEQQPHSSNL